MGVVWAKVGVVAQNFLRISHALYKEPPFLDSRSTSVFPLIFKSKEASHTIVVTLFLQRTRER